MLRWLYVLLAFISGAAALSHELLWTRRLVDLLGATESVTGKVLGLFFLGLSLGGWIAARGSKSVTNYATRLGIAEIAIAILSLPAVFLPLWADGMMLALGTELLTSWQGQFVKATVAALVVMPPAIAMGTTMPMLIGVMTQLGAKIDRGGISVYGLNMVGGVFGLWAVSTLVLEFTGVQGAMIATALCNVAVAIIALTTAPWIAQQSDDTHTKRTVAGNVGDNADHHNADHHNGDATEQQPSTGLKPDNTKHNRERKLVLMLAFASGVMVLASEVLALRLLALVTPSSLQTTSALLANVIFFLAVGAIAVAALNRWSVAVEKQLIIGSVGAALGCALCPLILYQVTHQLVSVRYLAALGDQTISTIGAYWWLVCQIVALSTGGAMFFFGIIFPCTLSLHARYDPKGREIGLLLASNGIGGLLGTELANQILIWQLGIYFGFAILAVSVALLTIAGCLIFHRTQTAMLIGCGVIITGLFCFDSFNNLRYLSPRAEKSFAIEATYFDRGGVLQVTQSQTGSRSLLMNNQYILGSSGKAAQEAEARQLLLPWLLHPESQSVCCLGFATGITASALELLQTPPAVTAVELSETVVDAARQWFGKQHGAFFNRAENRVIVEDARTFVACSNEAFDLIVADLFRPHGFGESRLFSSEHFQNVKRALRPEGLFCQWLPAHQLNQTQFETIAHTFQSVFPNALIVAGGIDSRTPAIGLCAWRDGRPWETEDLINKTQRIRQQTGVSDILVLNPQLLVLGVLKEHAYAAAEINTLDNALLEIAAGKFWLTKDLRPGRTADDLRTGFLSGKNWKRFIEEVLEKTLPVYDPIHAKQYLKAIK